MGTKQSTMSEHKLSLPRITFSDNASTQLEIASHHLKVQVTLPLAKVTSTIQFINRNDRTLAGELVFPLPDDATLIGYALDVNGTLVDAVPIEKEKAKVVFEEEVRSHGKAVAMVEMAGKSNSFKTSIYPLHPNTTRTVRVIYFMPVSTVDNQSIVVIPFGTPAPNIDVNAEIEWHQSGSRNNSLEVQLIKSGQSTPLKSTPTSHNGYKMLQVEKSEVDVNVEAITIKSDQKLEDNQVTVEGEYFGARIKVEQPQESATEQPTKIQILYDMSYSRRAQHKRDFELLHSILHKVSPKQIVFTGFSVEALPSTTFDNTSALLQYFNKIVYDGATNLANIEKKLDESAEYCILFTDGLHTIGKDISPETVYSIPLYVISTTTSSDQHLLSHIATKSGGTYINANVYTNDQIVDKIGAPVLYFLVSDYESEQFDEVYPNEPVALETGGFLHLYGRIKQGGQIAVMFRYGREHVETRILQIEASNKEEEQCDRIIPFLWAKQKLNSLSAFPQLFDQELRELAMKWKIVTANTSFIVLESVEQYLKHNIEPPKTLPQVHADYVKQKELEKQKQEQNQEEKILKILKEWESRKQWHKIDFVEKLRLKRQEEENRRREEENRRKEEENRRREEENRRREEENRRREVREESGHKEEADECIEEENECREEENRRREEEKECRKEMSSSRKTKKKSKKISTLGPRSSSQTSSCDSLESAPSSQMQNFQLMADSSSYMHQDQLLSSDDGNPSNVNTTASIQVQKWSSGESYMATIKSSSNPYETYLEMRKTKQTSPAFFLDISDYWLVDLKQSKQGINILTNLLELELESEQLLRIVGYRLDQEKCYELAENVFERVMKIRPDEPQSYRDLALIKEKLGKLEEAADLLNQVIYKNWDDRFKEIELTAAIELNHVLQKNPSLKVCHEGFRYKMDLDLRISMAWDTNDTDVDLHVHEGCQDGSHAYYGNRQTCIGGLASRDFTRGYGPEEYMLKIAPKGEYKVCANYFANHQQSLTGGTTILLTFFTNYMRPEEKSETVTVRLVSSASQLPVCTITV